MITFERGPTVPQPDQATVIRAAGAGRAYAIGNLYHWTGLLGGRIWRADANGEDIHWGIDIAACKHDLIQGFDPLIRDSCMACGRYAGRPWPPGYRYCNGCAMPVLYHGPATVFAAAVEHHFALTGQGWIQQGRCLRQPDWDVASHEADRTEAKTE